MLKYQNLADAIFHGDESTSSQLTRELIKNGVDPVEILNEGLYPGMEVVSTKFKNNEMFIPEVLLSAKAMHASMDVLKTLLTESGVSTRGTVVIGTVKGDLHDIGKNLVCMMLEGGGFTVIDMGVDLPLETFIAEAKGNKANIVGMSTLLTTTMPSMKTVAQSIRNDTGLKGIKIVVGGAPVTESYAESIGADGYAPDASNAVDLINKLVK
jgi:5-methyltetrahydrofolate--homocysteine methyltransferase